MPPWPPWRASPELNAGPIGPVQVRIFGLKALFVETHTNGAALAAQVQSPALLREVVQSPALPPMMRRSFLTSMDGARRDSKAPGASKSAQASTRVTRCSKRALRASAAFCECSLLDLEHEPVFLAAAPLDGPELMPAAILDGEALTEGVEAPGLRKACCGAHLVEKNLHQIVGFRPLHGGRVSVETDHHSPPLFFPVLLGFGPDL